LCRQLGYRCSDHEGILDLLDSNNEAAGAPATFADTFNISHTIIVDGWDVFASGQSNRQEDEVLGGGGDPNGMNLRDYFANNTGGANFGSGFFTTLLNHNCTGGQDDN